MTPKSIARGIIEKALDVQVIPPGHVALVFEQEHLRRFLARFEVDCVFDVGANRGQYASMLRTRAGYRGPIVSYEPIPELARELSAAAERDPAWRIESLALGETDGQTEFNVYASDTFSSLHAFSEAGRKHFRKASRIERRVPVRVATLARELEKHRSRLGFRHPFLKMDTQGHDLAVAAGAGERLREFVGLQSELAIEQLYAGSPSWQEALEFYRTHGFELSALVPNNLGHFPRLLEIDCIMFRSDLVQDEPRT